MRKYVGQVHRKLTLASPPVVNVIAILQIESPIHPGSVWASRLVLSDFDASKAG